MLPSPTHAHLLLNHIPIIGFSVAFGLFVIGLAVKSSDLIVASLAILIGVGLLTIPAYISGNAAGQALCVSVLTPAGPCPDPAVSRDLIDRHEGAALVSLALMELLAAVAWFTLWRHRRTGRIARANTGAVLVLGVLTLAAVILAADLGGQIRHPEVRASEPLLTPPLARIAGTFISTAVWAWPSSETLHFVGLTLLIGVILLINLKVLGVLPSVTYRALERLLPWGILGFWLNIGTGMAFFVAHPYQYVGNYGFGLKLAFAIAAGLNTLFFTFDPSWAREDRAASGLSKTLAVTSLVLWIGVMYWGSMLEFTRY